MKAETMDHLKNHVKWPATGQEIMDTCENMSDVEGDDKELVESAINPMKTYETLEELMSDIEKKKSTRSEM